VNAADAATHLCDLWYSVEGKKKDDLHAIFVCFSTICAIQPFCNIAGAALHDFSRMSTTNS